VVDLGIFNMIQMQLRPNLIQRHFHNLDQLVLVQEGEAILRNRRLRPGEGYATKAFHPYTITSGSGGVVLVEIRHEPLATLTTTTIERDPNGSEPRSPGSGGNSHPSLRSDEEPGVTA
jgi:hypothetical protein